MTEDTQGGIRPERTYQKIGETAFIAKRCRKETVVKTLDRKVGDPSSLFDEVANLRYLRTHYPTPRFRPVTEDSELRFLAMRKVEGSTLLQELHEQPDHGRQILHQFIKDTVELWRKTKLPMVESDLVHNPRQQTINTINQLMLSPEFVDILDKPITINGKQYRTLRATFEDALIHLNSGVDPVMVRGHGDEHLENILTTRDNPKGYVVIDPFFKGNYSPARTANMLIGYSYLFGVEYLCAENKGESLELHYSPKSENDKKAFEIMKTEFSHLHMGLEELSDQPFLLREYLLANLARTYAGKVHPKNKERIEPNRIAHLALAIEQYYEDRNMGELGQSALPR